MSDEYELVTFGHGTKLHRREDGAGDDLRLPRHRAPRRRADVLRAGLPVDDNLFDLIPASKLELQRAAVRRRAAPRAG